MTPVTFTRCHAGYNTGEVAGFPAEEAARLIEQGLAVPYGVDAPVESPKEVAPKEVAPKEHAPKEHAPKEVDIEAALAAANAPEGTKVDGAVVVKPEGGKKR